MINYILDNRYEILERVGGGGMAEVYRAHDRLLDRFVAIKILHMQFADDDEFITGFKKEAQGAAKLSHPNIVNIYDVGRAGNTNYIVMEYVSGETLKDKLQREKKLPVKQSLQITLQIAEALEHAHQNNLIHCDIKPHNILVMENGRIKVTDFGIARAVTSTTMTQNETVIGSVHYISPEQARGESISDKSDIYSLGVLLYELLTGTVPFQGETPVSIALKHLQEEARPIRALAPETPLLVEALVMKAMAKKIDDRFHNISEMIVDLKFAKAYVKNHTEPEEKDVFATQVLPKVPEELTVSKYKKGEKKNNKFLSAKSGKIFLVVIVLLAAGFALGSFLVYGEFWSFSEVTIPDVVGKQSTLAKHTLEEKNLRVNIEETFDDQAPAGQVVSQYPESGAVVKKQRMVTIYISKGGEIALAPDLHGLSRREAEIQLKNMGLQLGRIDEQASEKAVDIVIDQNPRQGTQVIKGYAVDIIVSKGAEKKAKNLVMPDLKGKTLDEAKKILEAAHLKIGVTAEIEKSDTVAGTILEQNPVSGAQVLEDTSIDLTIAKMPKAPVKRISFQMRVPDGTGEQAVQIVQTDKNGRKVVYENTHKGGELLSKTLEGTSPFRVQAYVNGNLIQEENF